MESGVFDGADGAVAKGAGGVEDEDEGGDGAGVGDGDGNGDGDADGFRCCPDVQRAIHVSRVFNVSCSFTICCCNISI